jgi:hypothetical protein
LQVQRMLDFRLRHPAEREGQQDEQFCGHLLASPQVFEINNFDACTYPQNTIG